MRSLLSVLVVLALPAVADEVPRPRLIGPPGVSPSKLKAAVAKRLRSKDKWVAYLAGKIRADARRKPKRTIPKPTDYGVANAAKAAALLGWATRDAAMRDRALAHLANCPTHPGRSWGSYIHVSEALIAWLQAYDLAAASGPVPAATTARVRTLAERFWMRVGRQNIGFIQMRLNNHGSKSAAALGVAAMCFAGVDEVAPDRVPSRWLALAEGLLERVYARQIPPDGGWGEGPKYQEYSAGCELPFLVARRKAGKDWFADERLRKAFVWNLWIRQPDGMRPNIDDSNYRAFYGGLLAGVYRDAAHLWDWQTGEAGAGFVGTMPSLAVDMLALWPDRLRAAPPKGRPSRLFAKSGTAVMRSGWGADDAYALLLGEDGPPHTGGGGHEHPDPLQLIVAARGERFVVDSGYVSWAKRRAVNAAGSHNLILVDGLGPKIFEAFGGATVESAKAAVGEWMDLGPLVGATSTATYRGVRFRRRVALLGDGAVVVEDEATGEAEHALELRWHLHAGGTVGGTVEGAADASSIVLRRPKAAMRLTVHAPEGATFAREASAYGQRYGVVDEITRWKVASRGKTGRWLTVMRVGKKDAALKDGVPFRAGGLQWTLARHADGVVLTGNARVAWVTRPGNHRLGGVRWTQAEGTVVALRLSGKALVGRIYGKPPTLTLPDGKTLTPEAGRRFAAAWK